MTFAKMEGDSRTYPRFKVINWPAMILTEEDSIDGTARNFSGMGAYIYYDQPRESAVPFPIQKRLAVVIRVPERLPLLIQAEVVWSKVMSSDDENTLLGVGVRFTEVFYGDRQFLREIASRYSAAM